MRLSALILLAAIYFGTHVGESQAQYPYPLGSYGASLWVNPYVLPPAYSASAGFASPYGFRTFSNFSAYPGPWGYNTFYNYGTFVRPYVSGPFHSVYYNPFSARYQYGPGYLNAPTFFYSYGFPY